MKSLLILAVLLTPLILAPLAMAFLVAKFYRKTGPSQAIIRAGAGGLRVVIGCGIWVIPAIHRFDTLDLSTKRIAVDLADSATHRSIATRDSITAHFKANFYVRVNPTREDVLSVAQTIGCRTMADAEALSELLSPKFSAVIQRVAARFTFDELQRDTDALLGKVLAEIGADLSGLVVDDAVVEYVTRA
jgi:uncharacterized membrane protein YqiK